MLRRNSTNRLNRRKSTSSTHSKHESVDPEVARQQAQAAASLAFSRAQERSGTHTSHRASGHSRSNTTSTFIDRQAMPQHISGAGSAVHQIKRQQSVRFAGPNAIERRQSISSRATQNIIERKPSLATLRPMAMTTNAPVPAVYRPPSRSSSIGKASIGRGKAESFVTAVAAYNEYYTGEDDIASSPSSYRRIRRSKSMFSPLKAPSVFYTNGTPEKSGSQQLAVDNFHSNYQTPQSQSAEEPLKVRRSMSFLRGGREYLNRDRNDVAVQMARDRFFQQTTQQRLREQPSFLFRSKARMQGRQEKAFRKSVRTSSGTEQSMPVISSDQVQPPRSPRLREMARKASKNIKDRFKKVFGRSKQPVDIPNQQVDAHETHVRKYCGDHDAMHNSFRDIPHPMEATLSRVASRPPSLHEVPSNQQLKSNAGSLRSTKSDISEDKSRVTSWNTSTGVNTMTSQAAKLQAERELQRLSIINENGTHVPSSSFGRPKLNQSSAYPHHHRPSKSAGHIPTIVPGSVDSARVYSALMKRLDDNSPKKKLEAARNASKENIAARERALRHSNSSNSSRSPATIRHVPAQNSNSSESSSASKHEHQWVRSDAVHAARREDVFGVPSTNVHQWVSADPLRKARMRQEDDVFSPREDHNNDRSINVGTQHESNTSTYTLSRQPSTKPSFYTGQETPQEIAIRNEPVVPGTRNLRESRSTFFGGSSFTIARTTSPFRRALTESTSDRGTSNAMCVSSNGPHIPNPLYLSSEYTVSQNPEIAYSDSIYSRTTSGLTPLAANSALSLLIQENIGPKTPLFVGDPGDVVIIDTRTYRPTKPDNKEHRVIDSGGSADWKKWMSSEVAKLERAKENTNAPASYVNYALPTMPKSFHHAGHIRESAQFTDDDTDIAQRNVSGVKQPLGVLHQNANLQNIPQISPQNIPVLKPILKNRSNISLVENTDSYTQYENENGIPIPPPPPIPPRSPLRPRPYPASQASTNTANTPRTTTSAPNSAAKVSSTSGRNLLHKRNVSTATLQSTKSIETPAKLVKKYKPPHAANILIPSSGMGEASEQQFGSTSTKSRSPGKPWTISKENHNPEREDSDDIYGTDGAGLMGPIMGGGIKELDAQQMGSKRMVDMFLSSRRKRIASGSEETAAMFI